MKIVSLVGSIILLLTSFLIGMVSLFFFWSIGMYSFLLVWALFNNFLIFIIFIISIIAIVITSKKNKKIIEENTDEFIVPQKESLAFAISGLTISVIGLFLTSILVLFFIVRIFDLNTSYTGDEYVSELEDYYDEEGDDDYYEEDEIVIVDKTIDDCTEEVCIESVDDVQSGDYSTVTLLEKNITENNISLKLNIENTSSGYLVIDQDYFEITSTSDEDYYCYDDQIECTLNKNADEVVIIDPNSELEIEIDFYYDINFGEGITEDIFIFDIDYYEEMSNTDNFLPDGSDQVEIYY